jgi:hypothetical protein
LFRPRNCFACARQLANISFLSGEGDGLVGKPAAARGGGTLLLTLATLVSSAVCGALLLFINPYGIWTKFDAAGRSMFLNIVSSSYAREPHPKTAVVLMTDESLRATRLSWPVPYEAYALVVDAACGAGARAVLLDFVFVDARDDPSIASLEQSLANVGPDCPVYIGALEDMESIAPIKQAVANNPHVQFVSIYAPEQNGARAFYSLAGSDALPSAALAMLPASERPPRHVLPETMDLLWRTPPAQWRCAEQGPASDQCALVSRNPVVRALRMASYEFAPQFFDRIGLREPARLDAPPFPTLPFEAIAFGSAETADTLRGAHVFFGGNFQFVADTGNAGPYGQAPGVYMHAAAFDNLYSLGSDVLRVESDPFRVRLQKYLQLLALVAGGCLVQLCWHVAAMQGAGPLSGVATRASQVLNVTPFQIGAIVAFIILAWTEMHVFRSSPGHWTGALAVTALSRIDFGFRNWLVQLGERRYGL